MNRGDVAARATLALLMVSATAFTVAFGARGEGPRLALVIDGSTLGEHAPLKAWSGKRPSIADVDRDGRLDVVTQNGNGRVYVLDTRTGRALAELEPSYPYGPDLGPFNGPRAADVDGDGLVEVVNVNRAAVVSVWRYDADDRTDLLWERHLDDFHGKPTADAGPVLGDLTGDGRIEMVIQTEETGVYALRHDGSTLWALPEWGGNAEALLADVDGNGALDAVFFTDAGRVYAVDGRKGEILWDFHGDRHGAWPGSAASPGIVADLDGDGTLEVSFCARNVEDATPDYAPGAPSYRQHDFVLFTLRDGDLLWKAKPEWGHPLCSAYLMAHDADGDGTREIFGMDWNTIGHKPGNWERTGNPHVFAFNADGTERWHVSTDAWMSKASIAIADWTGNGREEIVAYASGSLVAYDADTGAWRGRLSLDGWDVEQGPLFADLEGDGDLDAVVAVRGRSHAFLVYDMGVPYSEPAWPGWEFPVPDPPGEPPPSAEDGDPGPGGVEGSADAEDGSSKPPGRQATSGPGAFLVPAALSAAAWSARDRARRGRLMRRRGWTRG